MAEKLRLVLSVPILRSFHQSQPLTTSFWNKTHFKVSGARMASSVPNTSRAKIIDSHLHVWASPQEVTQHLISYFFFRFPSIATAMLTYLYWVQAKDKYPYFPGNEPTLPGSVDFLLQV